jgi:glycosyltransferase involved in cell wall biosynthesis
MNSMVTPSIDTAITDGNIRVAICISTFRRQRLLRELLHGIGQLSFRKVAAPQIEVVVVDTPDESGSAWEICKTVALPWPIKYVVEPRRGLTYARNRAVAEAASPDFIAFIDDDEVPARQWLDELLWTQAEFGAYIVSGPVFPIYAPQVPDWIKAGDFFASKPKPTGAPCRTCATHNGLVSSQVFKRVPGFDDAFALSGAEDTDFFLRATQAGCKIVWSQEAAVYEYTSASRGTIEWILAREYQTGNGWVFSEAVVDSRRRTWMVRFSKACGHVVIGSTHAFLRLLMLDRAAVVRALQRASLGAGMLAALIGHKFLAYQNVAIDQGD